MRLVCLVVVLIITIARTTFEKHTAEEALLYGLGAGDCELAAGVILLLCEFSIEFLSIHILVTT